MTLLFPPNPNLFSSLTDEMDQDLPEKIPETQYATLQPGTPTKGTPRANEYSDALAPSSPTFRLSQTINATQYQAHEPPTKKHRLDSLKDGSYKLNFYGSPSSIQEAVRQAANLIGKALHLTTNDTEKSHAMALYQQLEDFNSDRPMTRVVDHLITAVNHLEKTTRNLKNRNINATSATSSGSSTPQSSPGGIADSVWSPSNQLQTEQIKHAQPKTITPPKTTTPPKAPTPPKATAKTTRRSKRLILTKMTLQGFELNDSMRLRNALNKDIGSTMVASVTLSRTNNIILTTTNDHNAEELLQHEKKIRNVFEYREAKLDDEWSKIVIHGIPLRSTSTSIGSPINMNSDDGLKLVKEEISIFNKHLNIDIVDHIKWLSSPIKRENAFKASVILTLKNPQQAAKVIRQGLTIMGFRPRIEKLHDAPPRFQCNTCQQFGHYSSFCKREPKCSICGEDHHTTSHSCDKCETTGSSCAHTTFRCTNCKGNHGATDPICEVRPSTRPFFTARQ